MADLPNSCSPRVTRAKDNTVFELVRHPNGQYTDGKGRFVIYRNRGSEPDCDAPTEVLQHFGVTRLHPVAI